VDDLSRRKNRKKEKKTFFERTRKHSQDLLGKGGEDAVLPQLSREKKRVVLDNCGSGGTHVRRGTRERVAEGIFVLEGITCVREKGRKRKLVRRKKKKSLILAPPEEP